MRDLSKNMQYFIKNQKDFVGNDIRKYVQMKKEKQNIRSIGIHIIIGILCYETLCAIIRKIEYFLFQFINFKILLDSEDDSDK